MPSWWKSKSKSKSSPNSARKKDKDSPSAPPAAEIAKEKAKSFDESVVRRGREADAGSGRVLRFGFDGNKPKAGGQQQQQHAHPLPRPMISASMSMPHDQGGVSAGASASVSSVSSSGSSSEETADLGGYRYSELVSKPKGRNFISMFDVTQHTVEEKHPLTHTPILEHERVSNIPVSPRKGSQMNDIPISPRKDSQMNNSDFSINGNAFSHHLSSTETRSRPGSVSPGPRSSGYALPTSPVNSRVFGIGPDLALGKQDDLRSPPHPLPLPPGSPTSPVTRSLHSKWKKGKLLGSGTFGRVYAGFNSERGKMCAIKEVEVINDDSNSKECLKQLSQEINLLSQLSHPNIVQYYGSELEDGTLSVYLEYVSGGSIHKLLQDYGPFSEPVIRIYAGQILSGLAYLHGRNTLHRDIKGANILVGPNGEVKLADFGMAKHISSYTSIRSFKGSPYWMAPEVIMNANGYGLPVDIWSLGCTIIEMATSKPPWNNFTGVQAIFKIGNSKDIPDIPDHLSSDAKKFLKLCLQRDPSSRPTAAQLMDHPFVRDQAKVKISKVHASRDAYPSSSDGSRSPTGTDFAYNRSISPLQDRDYVNRSNASLQDRYYLNRNNSPLQDRDNPLRHTIGYSPLYIKTSEPVSLRMNMSLPVSPCSSPLRQFKQTNRSCIPSPPHPMHAMGAPAYGLGNASPHQMFASNRYTDRWSEVSQLNGLSPYGSPRKT